MNRRICTSAPKDRYMAPSAIHYIHPANPPGLSACLSLESGCLSGSCPELDRTVTELTTLGLTKERHFKIQIVEKDGHWFALNSAQLELCRRLEKGGLCPKVKVDVVPSQEVPLNVRNLMTLPVSAENELVTSKSESKTSARTTSTTVTTCREVGGGRGGGGGKGGGRAGGGGRKGYQQLVQEEQNSEDEKDDEDEEQEERSLWDDGDDQSNPVEDACDETDAGSSADAESDSDVDWSDGDLEISEGDWSNADDPNSCSYSDREEQDSEDEENNCLL